MAWLDMKAAKDGEIHFVNVPCRTTRKSRT
jgi:hypothetical protein